MEKLRQVLSWHWTHGPMGNEPAYIEALCEDLSTGEKYIMDVRDPEDREIFATRFESLFDPSGHVLDGVCKHQKYHHQSKAIL